ncbi:ECF-type riboflavin transporter substrate-binding protein [Dolosicoccus paucivorans]|uniref:UPF0397 protein CJ205_07075 n=1 Tax=Dolosicoccus paucivorans TaxID=84521 RepID=A0A1G8MM73_9LACT|nr:ECF-type riboflavin transporter substrate-binding protein [Dolosicoccus paucivorans]PMB83790.1 DUF3816 family protein [Dolosicoccus paucivorans]PMC57919.1 DUF3816 family protein [Dolosicoccus paucivorans]SDI68935.1 energy-coupling factor transport system substrate-specific component [Dolosicoccus paucivorans]
MKKQHPVTQTVATAIGAAIFFILMKFIAIPTPIPNTTIQVSYGFLALFAGVFGPVPAALAAFIGHYLTDVTTYGQAWFGWIVASSFVGYGLGYVLRNNQIEQGIADNALFKRFIVGEIIVNALAWALIAPILDMIVYREPQLKLILQGGAATILNAIGTGVIGWILIKLYANTRTKSRSLSKDD